MKKLAIFLLAVIPAFAADTPIVNVIGATEFEIPAKDPTLSSEVLPPIALLIANDLKPEQGNATSIKAKVLSVSIGTVAHPENGKAFEFGSFAAGKKGELRDLKVTVNLAEIPDPQTYIVRVLLFRDGDPSVASQTIDLKFTRPAAALSVAPLRLENIRFSPLPCVGGLSPNKLKFQETSYRAALTDVQVQVKDFLQGPNDFPVAAQLQVSLIKKIGAGNEETGTLGVDGNLPLGSTKGSLVVRSRQLAQPLDVKIEIVTRTTRLWLLLALIVSILLGYFFRVQLDARRAQNQSLVAAEQQFAQITDWKNKAIDPDLQNTLGEILKALRAAIEAKPFNATTLDAAVKKAASDTEAAIKVADDARNALRARLKTLRDKLGSPGGQPKSIANAITTRLSRLQEQERELNRGAVKAVSDELDKIDSEVQNELPTIIQNWAQQVHSSTDKMGKWTGLEFEDVRKKLNDATSMANAPALDLSKTRDLARQAQVYLVLGGLHQITDLSAQIIGQLASVKNPEVLPPVETCRTNLAALQKFQDADVNQIAAIADAIADLRSSLTNVINKVAAIKNVAKPDGLDDGDFGNAIAKLLESGEKSFGGPRPAGAVTLVRPTLSQIFESFVPQTASWWDIQLDVPVTPQAGEQITANVVTTGTAPDTLNFEWQIGDEAPRQGARTFPFTLASAGSLVLSVRAFNPATGDQRRASMNLQVRARHGADSVALLSKRLADDEMLQTMVSGVFIAVAGYAIFQANWYGTFLDFFSAALWGFSVDFSVAKVRDLASPLLGRSIPFAASK